MSHQNQIRTEAERITLIGALIDGLLGLAKIAGGFLAHSSALIADGIHSLSDLATDALVVVMLRLSHQPPDKEHPWGHGRIETLGTVILGCTLIAVAGAMSWDNALTLLSDEIRELPEWPALLIAATSVAAKEAIYRYTLAIGERLNSDLLIANAWHSRTDALSSIVVFVGVAGAMAGLPWLDAVAAIAVALMVAHIGWQLTWRSLQQLIDTALPDDELAPILSCARSVAGVINVHSAKSRYMGSEKVLEMHIQVSPLLTASEGHFIGDQVTCELQSNFSQLSQIIVHVDTYDDSEEMVCQTLPRRDQLVSEVNSWLEQHPWRLKRLDLHYQRDTVALELCLHWQTDLQHEPQFVAAELRSALNNPDWLGRIQISYGADG